MASSVPQVVEGFLKDLLGAKKAMLLSPAGNPLATEWRQRLNRSVESALEGFDLETRRITEISIDVGVETWELREFLEGLNLTYQNVEEASGLPAMLQTRLNPLRPGTLASREA